MRDHHLFDVPGLRLKVTEQTGRMHDTQEWQAAYAKLCIFVVDVTDRECLVKLGHWLSLVSKEQRFDGRILVVGNKIDLAWTVSRDMAQSWCADRDGATGVLPFMETSAIEGTGVDELFEELRRLLEKGPTDHDGTRGPLRQALAGPPAPEQPLACCPAVCCPCTCPGIDANWMAESEECSCILLPCMCGNWCECYLCGCVPCHPSSVATCCDPGCCCCDGCLPWCAYRLDTKQPLLDVGFTTGSMQRWGLPAAGREPDQPPRTQPRCFPACCCVHPCLRPRPTEFTDTGRPGLPFHLAFVASTCCCCLRAGPMKDRLECSSEGAGRAFEALLAPWYMLLMCCCGLHESCCLEQCHRVHQRRRDARLSEWSVERSGKLIDGEATPPPPATVMERDRGEPPGR